MDRWTDGKMDRWADGKMERLTDRQTGSRQMDIRTDGQTDRRTKGRTDKWIDTQMGWADILLVILKVSKTLSDFKTGLNVLRLFTPVIYECWQ
jgi:hypothetical protein